MNQVMKVLTVISTIFIPLTFITGLYGMNFKNMPELEWKYGYFAIWCIIFVASGALLYYFRKKTWL
jgi:magnesium transporter